VTGRSRSFLRLVSGARWTCTGTLYSVCSRRCRVAPAEMAAGVHPVPQLLSQYRTQVSGSPCKTITCSIGWTREWLSATPPPFTVDVREVSVVATADNCVQLIRQVHLNQLP